MKNDDIPIKAGHEFIVSTDEKYYDQCDDKVLYMDYVCYFPRMSPYPS